MKLIILLFLISLLAGCSNIRPDDNHSLSIPVDGLEVIQHTSSYQARENNALYLPSRRIKKDEFGTERLNQFITELRLLMHNQRGVGIAANQAGKNLQVFLIEAKSGSLWHEQLDVVPFQTFINPKITRVSSEKRNFWHGCLSARGEKLGNVATYDWIEYEAFNAEGVIQRGRLSGFAAVIFQHELRHLLGGTYLDKAESFIDIKEFYKEPGKTKLVFFGQADENLPLLLDDYVINETLEAYYQRKEID